MSEPFDPTLPLTLETLTAALGRDQTAFDEPPEDLMDWLQRYDEARVLELLIQISFTDVPVISPNAETAAFALNPYQAVYLSLINLNANSDPESELLNLSYIVELHFVKHRSYRPQLPNDHPLIQLLLQHLGDPNNARKNIAIRFLSLFGSPALFDILMPYWEAQDNEIALDTASALIALDRDRSIPIARLLSDSGDESARWRICYDFWHYPTTLATELLINRLCSDPVANVRTDAASTLGVIGDPRAIPALTQAVLNDATIDVHGHRVNSIASRAIIRILLVGFVQILSEAPHTQLDPVLAASFEHVLQSPELIDLLYAAREQYGSLYDVAPISYWRGNDPYTYFNTLDSEFGIRACFSFDKQDIYLDIDFHRNELNWIIDSFHVCS